MLHVYDFLHDIQVITDMFHPLGIGLEKEEGRGGGGKLEVTINFREGKGGDPIEDESSISFDQHYP